MILKGPRFYKCVPQNIVPGESKILKTYTSPCPAYLNFFLSCLHILLLVLLTYTSPCLAYPYFSLSCLPILLLVLLTYKSPRPPAWLSVSP